LVKAKRDRKVVGRACEVKEVINTRKRATMS